jgi:selenocysteine lyase/cysteine desulfurase
MWSRRTFLRFSSLIGTSALVAKPNDLAVLEAAAQSVANRPADDVAADEFYWREIQEAFTLDRTLINLNNGNSCPSPRVVHDAYKRYLDYSNQAPVYHRGQLEQNIETARRRLAAEFGADPEEIAITRNASESLQIAQESLDLQPGDEVITTDQDYPRMLTTWDQRVRRDKIKLTRIQFQAPASQQDLFDRFERAITPRTKVLLFCHITNVTGQLFPVQQLARMARQRGIVTFCDGAHALAHFPFTLRDLEVDYYGTSLHKWLLAPTGTGLLYVRRDRIATSWPLQAANERQQDNIRKFEQIGTAPAAGKAAINEAIAFHQAIGAERKAARLRYLTLRWANRVRQNRRVKLYSSLEPGQTWGLAYMAIDGVDPRGLSAFLWDKYKIIANAMVQGQLPGQQYPYQGIRVTPNVYTTLEEIDTFAGAIEEVLKSGLPAAARTGA